MSALDPNALLQQEQQPKPDPASTADQFVAMQRQRDPGLIEGGNIDLNNRPIAQNADGTYSTVRSISFEEDGKEVLVPTVVNGQVLPNDEAIQHYRNTGEHLGKFKDAAAADAAAQRIHEEGARRTEAAGLNGGAPLLHLGTMNQDRSADSYVASQQREQNLQAELIKWRAENDTMEPTKRAQVLLLSTASGMEPDYVNEHLKEVAAKVKADGIDFPRMVVRQPMLTKWLSNNPDATPLVINDLSKYATLEWSLRSGYQAFQDGWSDLGLANREFYEALNLGDPENQAAIRAMKEDQAGRDYGSESFIGGLWTGGMRMLPQMGAMALVGAAGRILGGMAGGAGGTILGLETGPGAVLTGEGGAAAGAAAGQAAALWAFGVWQSLGAASAAIKAYRDPQGKGIDPVTANIMAGTAAVATGALFSGLGGPLMRMTPGGSALLKRFGGATVEGMIAAETKKAALTTLVRRLGMNAAHGVAFMGANDMILQLAQEAAKGLSATGDFQANWGEVLRAGARGAEAYFTDMAGLAAFEPLREFAGDLGRAKRGAESAARLHAAVEATKDNELLKTMPAKFQELVAALHQEGKDAEITHARFSVADWDGIWKDLGQNPGEAASAIMGDGGKAYQDAVNQGTELAIPIEKYLATIGQNTKLGPVLGQDARLFPDVPSPREQAAEERRLLARLQEEAASARSEREVGVRAVRDTIQEAALRAGFDRHEAKVHAEVIARSAAGLGEAMGISPEEAAAELGVGRLRYAGPKGEAAAELAGFALSQKASKAAAIRRHVRDQMSARDAPRVIGGNKLVGAPDGRSSVADLERLARQTLSKMLHPYAVADRSAYWYENSGQEIARLTHGSPALLEKTLRLFAYHSAGNEIGGNTTAVIKALMQMARGEEVEAGRFPNVFAKRAEEILGAPSFDQSLPGVSDKIENFYRNLKDAAQGTDHWADASTMDRWMMRSFGYPERDQGAGGTSSKLSATQYKYAQFLTRLVGDLYEQETGKKLLPRQVQAVLWTYEKNASDAAKAGPDKPFTPGIGDFSDELRKATATVTWETIPSTKLHDLSHLTFDQKREFHEQAAALIFDGQGKDLLLEKLLGTDSVLRAYMEGEGAYEGAVTPNGLTQLALEKDVDRKFVRDLADRYCNALGYIYKQDAVPWHRPDIKVKGGTAGYVITLKGELTPRDQARLLEHYNRTFGRSDLGFTMVGNEVRVLNFTDLKNKDFSELARSAANTFEWPAEVDSEGNDFQAETSYIANDWRSDPDGQAYLQGAGVGGAPGLQGWLADRREAFEGLVRTYERPRLEASLAQEERRPGGPLWYSPVARAVDVVGAKQAKNTPQAWWAALSKSPGVKAEELEFLGLKDWLDKQGKTVTAESVKFYVESHQLRLEERENQAREVALGSDDVKNLEALYTKARSNAERPDLEAWVQTWPPMVAAARQQFARLGTVEYNGAQVRSFSRPHTENGVARTMLTFLDGGQQVNVGWEGFLYTLFKSDPMDALSPADKSDAGELYAGAMENLDYARDQAQQGMVALRDGQLDDARDYFRVAGNTNEMVYGSLRTTFDHYYDQAKTRAFEGGPQYADYTLGGHMPGSYRELLFYAPQTPAREFEAPHFGEYGDGLLAHARITEHRVGRTVEGEGFDAKRSLFIEEIQSDLHQQGRDKGYRSDGKMMAGVEIRQVDPSANWGQPGWGVWAPNRVLRRMGIQAFRGEEGRWLLNGSIYANEAQATQAAIHANSRQLVPDAPFKATWDEMVAKRLLRKAADEGYERIAWTTGEIQNQRYDISREVDALHYGNGTLIAEKDGRRVLEREAEPDELGGILGREVAAKLLAEPQDEDGFHRLHGQDIEVNGEGMKNFYDRRVNGLFEKQAKRYGGKVERGLTDAGNGTEAFVWFMDVPKELLEKARDEGLALFQRGKGGGRRGEIRLALEPGGRPITATVQMFEGKDRSTLAHETGHFLSLMLQDAATSPHATPELKADYDSMLKWMGYDSNAHRLSSFVRTAEIAQAIRDGTATPEMLAEQHAIEAKEERFSHAWEVYLAEGKAPTVEMESVFKRLKRWLLKVYSNIAGIEQQYENEYGQPLNMNPEVRAIFDRMLAGQQALDGVDAEMRVDPVAEALMTPAERLEMEKVRQKVKDGADADLRAKMADIERQRTGAARDRIAAQIGAQLDQQRVYRFTRFFQDGELVDSGTGRVATREGLPALYVDDQGNPRKLDRQAFVRAFGAKAVRGLPTGIFDPRKGEGMEPGTAAIHFGYDSAEEMIAELQSTPHRDQVLGEAVQAEMERQYGPALDAIQKAGMDAAHTDDAARAMLMENRAHARALDPDAPRRVRLTDIEHLHDASAAIVGEQRVMEVDPRRHLSAERAAALEAARQDGAGDAKGAAASREKRLLNHILYMEARDAKREVEQIRADASATLPSVRANLGKAGPEYEGFHDTLLAAAGFAPQPEKPVSLDAFLQRARADLGEIDFVPEQLQKLLDKPTRFDLLQVQDAQNLGDAITNIRRLAGERVELSSLAKKATVDDFFKRMAEHLSRRRALPPEALEKERKTFWEKVRGFGRGLDAMLTDMSTLAHLMDYGDPNGPLVELLEYSRKDAREVETRLYRDVLRQISKAWEEMPNEVKVLRDKPVDLSELGPPPGAEGRFRGPQARSTLWMLYLNWGNAGNRRWIQEGNGWSADAVQRALNQLRPEEVRFLQGILDTADALYPELAKRHKVDTGLDLPKVSATPITVNGVEYRGGYFPAKIDSRFPRTFQQNVRTLADLLDPEYQRPAVSKRTRISRQENSVAAVDLDWGVVPAHFRQVIHDISYGAWVKDVAKVILDPRFKDLVQRYFGAEREEVFVPWLRDVANARVDSVSGATLKFEREAGSWSRRLMAQGALAFNIPNQIQGTLDAWRARLEGVPMWRIGSAYARCLDFTKWDRYAPFADSQALDARQGRIVENMRLLFQRIDPGNRHRWVARIEDTGFRLYAMTDAFTTRVTFMAAYEHALSEGLQHEEAVRQADTTVDRLFPTHEIAERSPILRTRKGLGAILMFHTWANRNYNVLRRTTPGLGRWEAVGTLAARAMYYGTLGAASTYLIGYGPGQDSDKKDLAKWLAIRVGLEPLNTLPLVGGLLQRLIEGQSLDVRAAPEIAVVAQTLEQIGKLAAAAYKGDASSAEKALLLIDAAGAASLLAGLPVPVGQIHRTGSFLQGLADNEVRPKGPGDTVAGLLYGKHLKTPRHDPLTDAQNAWSALTGD